MYLLYRGGIHINILSCKTSFCHFGEWVSLVLKKCIEVLRWQNVNKYIYIYIYIYITTESSQCPNYIVHSLNLAKEN